MCNRCHWYRAQKHDNNISFAIHIASSNCSRAVSAHSLAFVGEDLDINLEIIFWVNSQLDLMLNTLSNYTVCQTHTVLLTLNLACLMLPFWFRTMNRTDLEYPPCQALFVLFIVAVMNVCIAWDPNGIQMFSCRYQSNKLVKGKLCKTTKSKAILTQGLKLMF